MKPWAAGLVVFFLLVTAGNAGAQSIAELAQKEAARRKALSASGKVLTDGNLRREAPSATVPASPAQMFSEALQTRINALTTDIANRNNRTQTDSTAAERQKSVAELNRVNQDIKDRQTAIAAIQDEARKAGVPPAWVQ